MLVLLILLYAFGSCVFWVQFPSEDVSVCTVHNLVMCSYLLLTTTSVAVIYVAAYLLLYTSVSPKSFVTSWLFAVCALMAGPSCERVARCRKKRQRIHVDVAQGQGYFSTCYYYYAICLRPLAGLCRCL